MVSNVKGHVILPQSYSSKCDFMDSTTSFHSELFIKLIFHYHKFSNPLNWENKVCGLMLIKEISKSNRINLAYPEHKRE